MVRHSRRYVLRKDSCARVLAGHVRVEDYPVIGAARVGNAGVRAAVYCPRPAGEIGVVGVIGAIRAAAIAQAAGAACAVLRAVIGAVGIQVAKDNHVAGDIRCERGKCRNLASRVIGPGMLHKRGKEVVALPE